MLKIIFVALTLISFYEVNCVLRYDIKQNHMPCLIVEMVSGSAQMKFPEYNKTVKFVQKGISKGACANTGNYSSILMPVFDNATLEFNFIAEKSNTTFLSKINMKLTLNGTGYNLRNRTKRKLSQRGSYFQCQSSQIYNLTNSERNAIVTISGMKIQAFDVAGKFSDKGEICPEDKVTTTNSPITTKTPPITTITPPTPIPKTPSAFFFVRNGGNHSNVCLLGRFTANFIIPYYKKHKNGTSKNAVFHEKFIFNNNTFKGASGSCKQLNETVYLEWRPSNATRHWNITLMFERKNKNVSTFYLGHIYFKYFLENSTFPNTSYHGFVLVNKTQNSMSAAVNGSYLCSTLEPYDLFNVSMKISNLTISAFRNSTSLKFGGNETKCVADYVKSNIVPIAVGIALALLVLIVVIVYLVGRRRRLTGYQSI